MKQDEKRVGSEIDLLDLFYSLWSAFLRFVKFILDTILYLFVFGLKRTHWLSLFLLLGIVLGYLIYSKTDRFYSAEMIAQPNGFTSIDMAQYINDIHEMCTKSNINGLSDVFQIPTETARLVKNIQAFYLIDVNRDGIGDYVDYKETYNAEDTTRGIVLNRILIRAEVFDNTIFHIVKNGLTGYIDNNPYLLKVNELRKQQLQSLITQSEIEISKLDSLQNYEYYTKLLENKLDQQGQIVFLNETQTQLYYRDKVALLSRQLDYGKALELATDPITIIKDFTELQTEENPASDYIIRYGFLLFIFGYFLMLIRHFWPQISSYITKLEPSSNEQNN